MGCDVYKYFRSPDDQLCDELNCTEPHLNVCPCMHAVHVAARTTWHYYVHAIFPWSNLGKLVVGCMSQHPAFTLLT